MFSTYKDDYVGGLEQQLAKANERVSSLVGKLALLSNAVYNPVFSDDMAQKECRKVFDSESNEMIKKFAIEQKAKGVEDYKKSDEFCRLLDSHFNSGKVYGHNEYYEQLRKEQDK